MYKSTSARAVRQNFSDEPSGTRVSGPSRSSAPSIRGSACERLPATSNGVARGRVRKSPFCDLIEQNAFQALRLSARAYVMVNGRIAREGSGIELLSDPQVQAAYLEGGLGLSAKEPAS